MAQESNAYDNIGDEIANTLAEAGFDLSGQHCLQYYFYFPSKELAEKLSVILTNEGFCCEVDESAGDNKDWLCLAKHQVLIDRPQLTELGKHFAKLSSDLGGEFDGWERAPIAGEKLPPNVAIMSGVQLYQQGQYEQTITLLNQVIDSSSENANKVWPLIGLSHLKLENHQLAVEAFEKAISFEPDNLELKLNIGVACYSLKQFDKAISFYNEILNVEPKNSPAQYNLLRI